MLRATQREELEGLGCIIPGDDIEMAKLGEPYAHYRMDWPCVQKQTDFGLFRDCLIFCSWDIPVSFGNGPRIVLRLFDGDEGWHVGGYSTYPLSFLQDARSRWPRSDGYTLSYLMGIRGIDFLVVERGNQIGLCSFGEGNDRALNITRDESGRYPLLDIAEAVKKLKRMETCISPEEE
jgi:hypothetical protein